MSSFKLAAVLAPHLATAFIEELFGQMQGMQMQQNQPEWPNGVSDEINKKFSWVKGTTWHWDNWREVQFQQDGTFDAPTRTCQHKQCKWTATDDKIYVWWGQDGLHVMKTNDDEAKEGARMQGKRKGDKNKINAKFVRIHDTKAILLEKDLYETLGVDVDCDAADIKKSYRKLSIKYHPDKCTDEECARQFEFVRDAYEILSDGQKKILYDTGGRQAVEDAEKGQIQKGKDVQVEISVTLRDLYIGNTVETSLQRRVVCVGCDQARYKNTDRCRKCSSCPSETKTVMKQMGPGMFMQQQVNVPSNHKCKNENTAIEATIEKGMDNGHTIKYPMMAEQRPGIVPGDVIFAVKTKPHSTFERKGKNLWMTIHLTVKEALLGFKRSIKHLDGHTVKIQREGVTRPEFVMKVDDEGMPVHNTPAEYGALFCKFVVDYPRTLTKAQQKLVSQVFPDEADAFGHDEL